MARTADGVRPARMADANGAGNPAAPAEGADPGSYRRRESDATRYAWSVSTAIDGFAADESAAILGFLYDYCIRPEFLYRHRWREKDLVIWDNRAIMHFAVMNYTDDEPRYMERCTVIGEQPV